MHSKMAKPVPVLFVSLILALTVSKSNADNILFFTNFVSSYSHQSSLEPLAIKLAGKGHNITIFTPVASIGQSSPHPNITKLCTQEVVKAHEEFISEARQTWLQSRVKTKYVMGMDNGTWLFDLVFRLNAKILKSVEIHDLFQRSKFDMLILDKSSMGEVILGFAYKFNISKMIFYMAGASLIPWEYDLVGISSEISWAPTWQTYYQTKELSFLNRLQSEISICSWYFGYTQYLLPNLDKLVRDGLQLPNMPPMQNLVQSESLIFINGHYSDTFSRSLPPYIVEVGGMHLQDSSGKLPPDIRDFLSLKGTNITADFLYISFGSLIQSSRLEPKLVQAFLDAFESLASLKFLWKWEAELPKNIPTNVLLRKWFPQQDILAHGNVRGFVTQGGQMSLQQAIFNAVPLIILPVDGDQDYNAKRIRNAGNGIELEFFDLTVETIRGAINNLLTDKNYSQVASKLSIASKQRPMHPLDLAVWWTEFVLSQDDVSYLRPKTKNILWWVTRSLDVWALIFLILVMIMTASLLILCKSVKFMLHLFLKNDKRIESDKKTM